MCRSTSSYLNITRAISFHRPPRLKNTCGRLVSRGSRQVGRAKHLCDQCDRPGSSLTVKIVWSAQRDRERSRLSRARLEAHIATHDRQRAFRLHYGSHLAHQLTRAKLAYLGLPCPVRPSIGWRAPPNRLDWVTFHSFRHTWATWMRQAGTDTKGLVATGNWRSERSANRYAHAVARDEWDRVHKLPSMGKTRGKVAS